MSLRLAVVVLALVVIGAGFSRADTSDLRRYLDRGHALSKAGKSEQALPYLLLALELGEKQFSDGDPGLVPLLDSVAEVYTAQGSYTDAEPLLERSLAIQERALARSQAGIARTLSTLGLVYESTGRQEEAGKLYNRVLAVWQPTLGPDDPSVIAARDALAKLAAATPATAPATPPTEGRYRVHLTSIRDPNGAKREWARLRQMYPELLADIGLAVERADLGASRGVYYRIEGGPLNKAEANDRCMTLARRGVWCRVVATSGDDGAPSPVAAIGPKSVSLGPPATAGFRIHLSSIRDSSRAEEEWSRLRRLYPKLLGNLGLAVERADLGPERGIYYRIEGGPLTKSAAQKLCGTFSARQVWCGIVQPTDGTAEWPHAQLVRQARRRGPQFSAGTRRPDAPRRRQRLDRSIRGPRPEPGARRYSRGRGAGR